MDPVSITLGIFFLVQLVVGSLGNLSILLSYCYVEATGGKHKPIDVLVFHLAFVNLISLVVRGIPQIMTLFGAKGILNDAGCKTVMFVYRVTRALSVSTTCTLTVFQSATIAPVTSCWGKKKRIIPKYMIHSFIIFWTLNCVSFVVIPLYTVAPKNNTIPPNVSNVGFCYTPYFAVSDVRYILHVVSDTGQNALIISAMILSSCYILQTLKRHHKQVRYITNSRQNLTEEAEVKASKTIIKLVALYGICYITDIIIKETQTMVRYEPLYVLQARVLLSSCYQLFSPFILTNFNKMTSFRMPCSKQNPAPSANCVVSVIRPP